AARGSAAGTPRGRPAGGLAGEGGALAARLAEAGDAGTPPPVAWRPRSSAVHPPRAGRAGARTLRPRRAARLAQTSASVADPGSPPSGRTDDPAAGEGPAFQPDARDAARR